MQLVDSGRGLTFVLGCGRRTIDIEYDGTLLSPVATAAPLAADEFRTACADWSVNIFDQGFHDARYPLVRREFDRGQWYITVTVAAVGADRDVARIAEVEATQISDDLLMVDRTEPKRTAEGITYGFAFQVVRHEQAETDS